MRQMPSVEARLDAAPPDDDVDVDAEEEEAARDVTEVSAHTPHCPTQSPHDASPVRTHAWLMHTPEHPSLMACC